VPSPTIDKAASLDDIRAQHADLLDQLAVAENAPLTAAEAKAATRAQIELIAERGQPNVSSLFHGGAIAWPDEILVANGAGHHQYSSVATIRDAFALTVLSIARR
jgi:hypothetical protein